MKALIIGATGAVGKDLTDLLLANENYSEVHIFVRREVAVSHPKLKIHIVNFDAMDSWKSLIQGDVAFSCLGTTLKTAGSKAAQWKIDYDYQYNFARFAQENAVNQYVLVSASGANPKSFLFYSKMKGQLEEAVKNLNFSCVYILRPPLLVRKNSDRQGEKIAEKILTFFNRFGLFRSQKPMPTQVVAQAMTILPLKKESGIFVFSPQKIWKILK
ncbi:NAD(P)H-binding protein [Capnocytophaga sp.]|uniref:NAD(P)H-binding protein n=1 Tax=Capnocytophaga sp. TaxID=44737 RepID=UPI0026DC4963|nr:NAD(P)H-binding protein [Capnocytophaga sp.]MDO5106437.1 NAD(P)H-binding protein [Capnocytophaga sp.]